MPQKSALHAMLTAVLCLVVVLVDLATPRGVAIAIAYAPLIFCSLWFPQMWMPFAFAAIASVLAIVSVLLKPPSDVTTWVVGINRIIALVAVWFMAVLVYLRRKAEIRLQESTEINRAILETTVDGMITIDTRGIVRSFNPACERIFGYRAQEVIGRNVSMLMTQENSGKHDGYLKNYQETGRAKIIGIGREVMGRRKDGSEVPLDLSVAEMTISGQRMYSGIVRDISERKTTERALRSQKEELQTIFDNAPVIICYKDDENRILRANKAFADSMGLKPEELEGVDTAKLFPDLAEKYYKDDMEVIESGKPKLGIIETYRDGKGNMHWVRTDKVPYTDPNGKRGLLAVAQDITAVKEGELQLEKMVAQLTASNEELERFAYICSHDLQEPLRIIRNYVAMLERQCSEAIAGDEKAQRYMRYIVESAERSQGLINDILAYARVDQETRANERVDLNYIVESVLQNLGQTIAEKKAQITSDKLPEVTGNPTQFIQLFQNLIGNALKFCSEKPSVHIGAKQDEGGWEFSVRDNGIGIEPEYRDKIFIIFQRLHRRSDYPGTGIGLAICKKIVSNYGGNIRVESEPGKGTTFLFTLPAAFERQVTEINQRRAS